MLKIFSLIGLLLYFAVLLIIVLKEKKNATIKDYFFASLISRAEYEKADNFIKLTKDKC